MTSLNQIERINFNIKDGTAYVGLNRTDKCNAFDMPMFRAVRDSIKRIRRDKKIRAVIVYGEGNDFSTGLDVKAVMSQPKHFLELLWKPTIFNSNLAQFVSVGWRKLNIPVIMALHGRCWGAGVQVALGGDIRVAAPDASLSIMESKWGLIPDMGGSVRLKDIMGLDKALEWTMTSEVVTGAEALENGLVSHIAKNPLDKAIEIAERIKERSPDAVGGAKSLYQSGWGQSEPILLARETLIQLRMLVTKNRQIAIERAKGNTKKEFI